MISLPFLSAYDPPGSSEGSIDPLGLYMLADQLATKLVPAIRERMQRIRFLTPMTVGAVVTEDLEANPRHPETPPYQVWEWLVIEAIVRTRASDWDLWGVPGSDVTRSALSDHGYLDQRSYLKTPGVFGFHGVYKRLAIHLGLLDSNLHFRAARGEELIRAWSQDLGLGRFDPSHRYYTKWRKAVELSLRESPVRTRPGWTADDWRILAEAFLPDRLKFREKRFLKKLLFSEDDSSLEALTSIWEFFDRNEMNEEIDERRIHSRLCKTAPRYTALLEAISAYEAFARNLTDAFDILRAEATHRDVSGCDLALLRKDDDFRLLADQVHTRYRNAARRMEEVDRSMWGRFRDRFACFADPMPPGNFAATLCEHHERIQRAKSREGKRPWFDRMGPDRIYVRQNYRIDRQELEPEMYVHGYRAAPIHRFRGDLQ